MRRSLRPAVASVAARALASTMASPAIAAASTSTTSGSSGLGAAAAAAAAAALFAASGLALAEDEAADVAFDNFEEPNQIPERPDLPIIPLSEVKKHYDTDVGDGTTWVTFRGGVYDVTEFLPGHLGRASRLKMAAGGDLEPYWNVYRMVRCAVVEGCAWLCMAVL